MSKSCSIHLSFAIDRHVHASFERALSCILPMQPAENTYWISEQLDTMGVPDWTVARSEGDISARLRSALHANGHAGYKGAIDNKILDVVACTNKCRTALIHGPSQFIRFIFQDSSPMSPEFPWIPDAAACFRSLRGALEVAAPLAWEIEWRFGE